MHLVESVIRNLLEEQTRKKLNISLPDDLLRIVDIFKAENIEVYLVGGAVRDAVMGKSPKDWDLATSANPDVVLSLFEDKPQYKLLTVGKSFGVVVIVTPEGGEYEVATFRKDLSGGRRPDAVEFTDIATDVSRRDLTINALFYDLQSGEVVDYVGGLDDIKNNVVRTVGEPQLRFDEDRLRVLRAFRFAGRMGAKLDKSVADAIKDNNHLTGVSPERIRDEFLKGITSAKSVRNFLQELHNFGMFSSIFPGLKINTQFFETKDVPVVLALLLNLNDTVVLTAKLNTLKYTSEEVSQVTFLVDFGNENEDMLITRMKKSYSSSHLQDSSLIQYSKFLGDDSLARKFLSFSLTVSPKELMDQGFSGKALGTEIARLEQERWSRH